MGFSVLEMRRSSEKKLAGCYLEEQYLENPSEQVIYLTMDFDNNQ